MSAQDAVAIVICTIVGAAGGGVMAGAVGALIGGVCGGAFAVLANRILVRPVITVAVFTGTAIGVVLGRSIVHTLCLPGTCVPLEVTSAILLGAGAFLGVGLVAALVVRSFDEYRETGGRPR